MKFKIYFSQIKPSWNTAMLIHVHIVSVCTQATVVMNCRDKSMVSKAWSIYSLTLQRKTFAALQSISFKTFFLCICVNICVCIVFKQCSHSVCFLNLLFWENIMCTSNFCWVIFLFHWSKILELLKKKRANILIKVVNMKM